MIYFLGASKFLYSDLIKSCTFEFAKEYLEKLNIINLDTETTGLSFRKNKLISIQLGDAENQFVFDTNIYPVELFKDLLENPKKLFIGHNIKFDLGFLLQKKIVTENVYCTYVSEQILFNNGLKDFKKSLDYLSYRYCGEMLDKTIRKTLAEEGFTERVIVYCAKDIKNLSIIRDKQLIDAKKKDLIMSLDLNNKFVPILAYIECSGIRLDVIKWKEKIQRDKQVYENHLKDLNNYIIDNNIKEFIETQQDLWDKSTKTNINWQSPSQVIKLFKILNIDTKILDKETGGFKDSVGAKTIEKFKGSHPIIAKYIEFKEAQKLCSTYGENFLTHVDPKDERIYTTFQQWMKTGRMSCGSKNKPQSNKEIKKNKRLKTYKVEEDNSRLNIQNIPSDEYTRSCFIPAIGNKFVDCDYSGQEDVIFANKCLDTKLLEFYDSKLGDGHSFMAKMCFPNELKDLQINEVKANRPDLRQKAKSANFAIKFGGNGSTIANNLNISLIEGEAIYNNYMKSFEGIAKYFNKCYQLAKKRGYILYNEITRDKFFIPKGMSDGEIRRSSYNFPIQGSASSITKFASILYYRHLKDNDLLFKVLIANIVHDELLLDCPMDLIESESAMLQKCMIDSGIRFKQLRVPLNAKPIVCDYWQH